MNVFSKFDIDNKFIDIQAGEYNLGIVPNLIIDKMIHELRFADVKHQVIGRYKHRQLWENVMVDLEYGYNDEENDIDEAHNWFVETYGTVDENPDAYAFYHDLVYGV